MINRPTVLALQPIKSVYSQDTLVDSLGYKYTLKVDKRRTSTTWRCSVRGRSTGVTCKATVLQRHDGFVRGANDHVCGADPGTPLFLHVYEIANIL